MQPTARSTSHASSSTGTTPAEWHRSQSTSAPGVMHDPGQPGYVGQPGRAVGDVVEDDQRGLRADDLRELLGRDAGGGVDLDPAQGQPGLGGDAGGDVAVGRELVAVQHDLGAAGTRGDGGPHQLVEQHRGRVADGHLPGRRTEHTPRRAGRRGCAAGRTTARPSRGSAGRPTRARRTPRAAARSPSAAGPASCRRSRRAGSRRRRSGRGTPRAGRPRRARGSQPPGEPIGA